MHYKPHFRIIIYIFQGGEIPVYIYLCVRVRVSNHVMKSSNFHSTRVPISLTGPSGTLRFSDSRPVRH